MHYVIARRLERSREAAQSKDAEAISKLHLPAILQLEHGDCFARKLHGLAMTFV